LVGNLPELNEYSVGNLPVSYSKLVWSGVKYLFDIFLHYLNIPFTIVRRRDAPRREEPAQGRCESGESQNSIESRFG
jgi:hypothetical protein